MSKINFEFGLYRNISRLVCDLGMFSVLCFCTRCANGIEDSVDSKTLFFPYFFFALSRRTVLEGGTCGDRG